MTENMQAGAGGGQLEKLARSMLTDHLSLRRCSQRKRSHTDLLIPRTQITRPEFYVTRKNERQIDPGYGGENEGRWPRGVMICLDTIILGAESGSTGSCLTYPIR